MKAYRTALATLTIVLSVSCVSTGTREAPQPQPAPPAAGIGREPADPDLAALIEQGDAAGLQAVFKGRELANKAGADGRYPLHVAAAKGSREMIEILLAMGAAPDPQDATGKTPLRYAVDAGDAASARALIARGASVFVADKAGLTPLDAAIASSFAGKLLDKASASARGPQGETPLHVAVNRLSLDAVRAILALDPDVSARTVAGLTPLDAAFLHPNSPVSAAIAELLVGRNAQSSMDDFGYFIRAVRDTNYSRARFADGATVLHEAVRYDHRGYLSFFLDRGVPVDARNASGATALHDAMRQGKMEAAAILLEKGADPNARDGSGNTPLHLALPSSGARAAMDMLLARGADPSIKDRQGNTALHIAISLGYPVSAIESLLSKGVPVDGTNADGDTALTLATRRRNAELMPTLVARGASVFVRNAKGETPLSIAFADGPEATRLLVAPAPKDIRDDAGDSPFHYAVRLSAAPAVIASLRELGLDPSARNNEGDTALHLAVRRPSQAQGLALLEAGSDPFAANVSGVSALTLALAAKGGPPDWFFTPAVLGARDSAGNGALHYAAMAALPDGAAYLARRGVPVDGTNAEGRTALMLALKADSVQTVNVLLSLGADPARRDGSGASALHLGVYWSAHACLQVLIAKTSNVDVRDYTGKTPLRDAVDQSDAQSIGFLLQKGADPLARDNSGETPLHAAARRADGGVVTALASKARYVDARDDGGATPLLEAVYAERLATARLLAEMGASIHARDAGGESPLSFALRKGPEALKALLTPVTVRSSDADGHSVLRAILDAKPGVEFVQIALTAGAPWEDRDSRGRSPLHVAAAASYHEIVMVLMDAGADPFARDADGRTAAAIAMAAGDVAVGAMFAARPNMADYLGETALHYAAAAGLEKAALALLSLGADPSKRNALGETPSDVARRRGYETLAGLLKP